MTEQKKISKAIEEICHQGCDSVNNIIQALENGEHVQEAIELKKPEERSILLAELKEIMDVYKKR